MHKRFLSRGFILPVVVILSLALSVVSVTAFQTVSNSSVTLNTQYYNQLAQEAAQSGANMAISCIKQGTLTWPSTLKPNTNCLGTSDTTPDYVGKDSNWVSTFEVGAPTTVGTVTTITAIGKVSLTSSNGVKIGQTFTKNVRANVTVTPGGMSATPILNRYMDVGGGSSSTLVPGTTCVVADGKAYCWGNNYTGQLGNGTASSSSVPVAVSTSGILNGKTVTDGYSVTPAIYKILLY